MKRREIIERFTEFLNEFYLDELVTALTEDKKSISIDFKTLDKFNIKLADELFKRPEKVIELAEESIKQIDTGLGEAELRVRFFNLPESKEIRIRNIRAEHMSNLLVVDGIVKRASEIRPEVSEGIFSCPDCGATISVLQDSQKLKKPSKCECGRKRGFKLVKQKMYDARWITIEEPFEITEGEQPSDIMVFLKEDLTTPLMQNRTDPGNRIKIAGVLKQMPKTVRGSQSRQLDIYIDANYVEPIEVGWEELKITPEDEEKIQKLAKDPMVYQKLVSSLAPGIYGMNEIKEAIIMQMFSGIQHTLKDSTRIRGNIHILLVGDPSTAKCLTGDAKVVLADGNVRSIKEVVDGVLERNGKERIDDGWYAHTNHDILSLDEFGKLSPAKTTIVWKRESPDHLIKIETAVGRELCVTPTHPILTCNGNIMFKEAEKIKEGDYLATPRKLPIEGSNQRLDIDIKRSPANAATHIRIPRRTSPELCRFLGYLVGKGYLCYTETSASINVTNNNEFILEDFKNCAKKLFGDLHLSERGSRRGKTAKDLCISSIELGRFLEKLEPRLFEHSSKKRIPDIIMKCSNDEIREFIKAYFDGEATVSKKEREISVTSASEELLEQVQVLLLRFGILSQIHPTISSATNTLHPKKEEYYKLTISSQFLVKFAQEIGFNIKRKRESIRRLLNGSVNRDGHKNIDLIPNISDLLLNLRKKLRLTQFETGISRSTYQHYERGDRFPTRKKLLKIVNVFEKKVEEAREALNYLNGLDLKKEGIEGVDWKKLKRIREQLHISQISLAKRAGISQTLISQYELGKCGRGKIKPKVNSVLNTTELVINALKDFYKELLNQESKTQLKLLKMLATSDIQWDKITKIDKIKSKEKWVYDLQVDGVHNFVSNNIIVHNSQLMKLASTLIPRGKYASGTAVTGAGLTATVMKDEQFFGGWVLEAGALVLANKSICAIDEFSHVAPDDMIKLQEAMSLETISIAKASIVASLPAQTAILAGANPKFGRFDPYIPIKEQLDSINDVLLSRFDLRFALRDVPQPERDEKIASHILKLRHFESDEAEPEIDPLLLRKYIAYARANVKPELTREAGEALKDFYLNMRSKSGEDSPVSITLRQYDSLIRLAEASAKVRLSDKVEEEDAQRAIQLMSFSLRQFGFEPETGKIDIDRVEGQKMTSAQRSKTKIMIDLINALEAELGKDIPKPEVVKRAREEGINNAEEMLNMMIREGVLYQPKPNVVRKI